MIIKNRGKDLAIIGFLVLKAYRAFVIFFPFVIVSTSDFFTKSMVLLKSNNLSEFSLQSKKHIIYFLHKQGNYLIDFSI